MLAVFNVTYFEGHIYSGLEEMRLALFTDCDVYNCPEWNNFVSKLKYLPC